jgi:hypothetical protein
LAAGRRQLESNRSGGHEQAEKNGKAENGRKHGVINLSAAAGHLQADNEPDPKMFHPLRQRPSFPGTGTFGRAQAGIRQEKSLRRKKVRT